MRKLVYGINITLDGCCDHTKGTANSDVHEYFGTLMQQCDLLLYGRKTYELMVPFWPEVAKTQSLDASSNAFAKVFDSIDRVVVSRTLKTVDDKQTTILQGDLKEEVLKLKQQPGKDISTGGVDLPGQLIALGLVDEFHIVVHPVIVGTGRRLFDDVDFPESVGLKLVETKKFASGHVALCYIKA
jgi:Dihydrofolate reductase